MFIYIYIYTHTHITHTHTQTHTHTHTHTAWFKKMDSISYIYISWIIHLIWMNYITFKRGDSKCQIPSLECSLNAEPCSSVSWEQNGYCSAQDFLRVSEENVRWIQESFERSPRKSTHRTSSEYRNQLSGLCWGAVYSSIESIFFNHPVCVCVYVCVCVCVCVCVYIYMYIYIYIYLPQKIW